MPPTEKRVERRACSVLLMLVMVLSGLHETEARVACLDCASPKKSLPARSAYWEAKLGLPALTEGPRVTVTVSPDGLDAEHAALLAGYAGTPAPLRSGLSGFETKLSVAAAKALLLRGVALTPKRADVGTPTLKAAPANDACADATTAELGLSYTGSTVEAHDSDVWYTFSPPNVSRNDVSRYEVSLAGSSFDTILDIFDECGGALLDTDDDGGPGATSALIISLSANETYYIRITGFFGGTGEYRLLISSAGPSQPGESCTAAIPIGPEEELTGTTDEGMGELWFVFAAEADGFRRFSTEGSDYDTILRVYGQCGGAVVAQNDDHGELETSALTLPVIAGQVYYIRLSGFFGATGNYRLSTSPSVASPGEFRELPIVIEAGSTYSGDTGTLADNRVWFQYTASETTPIAISLLGSEFDTVLAVRDETDRFMLAYNDDAVGLQSRLSMDVVAGRTYLIVVSGLFGDSGPYTLQLMPVEAPLHDSVATPMAIRLGESLSNSSDGSTSTLGGSQCGLFDSRDVWYAFVPSTSGFVEIDLRGEDFDPTLTLFDVEGGQELACCDDRNDCQLDSRVYSRVSSGREYLIRVAGYDDTTGHFQLGLRALSLEPPLAPQTPQPQDQAKVSAEGEVLLSWDARKTSTPAEPSPVKATQKRGSRYTLKSIYGPDDRMDEYEVQDPQVLRAGAGTCVLVERTDLTLDPDGAFYRVAGTALHQWVADLCPDEPYYNQPAPGFCSGFLVAPDLVVTAGHCVGCEDDLADMAVLFGFVMLDGEDARVTLPAEDVYFVDEIVASQNGYPDWGLLRLNRPVPQHLPLSLRRAGRVAERQPLIVIGHPLGLPRKYDMGGSVRDNWFETYFSANLDAYGGSSGSAVLNADTLLVEGIVVSGSQDFDDNFGSDCSRSATCPDTGCPGWEQMTRATLFSGLIPSYDLLLGTAPQTLSLVLRDCPVPECRVSKLTPGQTYYWQVVAHTLSGQASSPVWSFKVDL